MFENLTQRERYLVAGLAIFLTVMGIYLGIGKVMAWQDSKSTEVERYRKYLTQINQIKSTISDIPAPRQIPDKTQLLAKVSSLISKHSLKASVIRDRVENKKEYDKIIIDLSFSRIELKNLFDMLYDVEHGNQVTLGVEKLYMRRSFPTKEVYDINLTLAVRRNK